MKSNCKPCEVFGYDSNDGMKAFCIVEMCLAVFHLIVALSRIPVLDHWVAGYYKSEGEDYEYVPEQFWAFFIGFFMCTLIGQSILAFLLYFLGWKKKNWVVCLTWVVFAAANVLLPWILLIFYLTDCEGLGSGWDYHLLYLLYPIYGIWIVITFMIGEIGSPRGRFNPNLSSSPSRARPDSSKPNTQV